MKLVFRVIVIDDNPEAVQPALDSLKEHLEEKGFEFEKQVERNLNRERIEELGRQLGKEYDLILIDYNLGLGELNGADAAHEIRKSLLYTDMVFYSSNPPADLINELAEKGVQGVFVARRDDELDDKFIGVADTVIGKAVDLTHMRGIAMAQVADMDVLMEETLIHMFESADEKFEGCDKRTLSKLLESKQDSVDQLGSLVEQNDILSVIRDSRHFSSAHKIIAIKRLAKRIEIEESSLKTLNDYENDIIHNRNTLAHVKEETDTDGRTTLRSIKRGSGPTVIDEEWMTQFRRSLKLQRVALENVCEALIESIG